MKSPIQSYLEQLHAKYAGLNDGAIATYIPELAKADPDGFGICVVTADGGIYETGDARQPFTIQSISKPLTYGMALEDRGRDVVLGKIGVEPTGDAFNSISLAAGTGRPLNPMINAGAIAAASLVSGRSEGDKLKRLLGVYSLYAGRPLEIDEAVYRSELETGHRNRAIGHMLRNFDIIEQDPVAALDLYFRQCSVQVTCRDLAVMAATLANGGVNPLSGERAVSGEFVADILSVMTTCGMYDYAGEWVHAVGMPGKSGVAGGILAVLPGQLGIGVFSPRLDARGNSVRGVQVCKDLSRDLQLHFLRVARAARSAVRAHYSLATVRSKRLRSEAEAAVLRASGESVKVYEMQGDLLLPAIEAAIRAILAQPQALEVAVLDLSRVTQIAAPAARLLFELLCTLQDGGKQLALVPGAAHARFSRSFQEINAALEPPRHLAIFNDLDTALEWAEARLIARGGGVADPTAAVALAQHGLCRGLDAAALAQLESRLQTRRYAQGEYIVRKGDPADGVYLLMSGQASVVAALPDGRLKRLSTLCAGMTFGDLAIVDRTARSADVRADTALECRVLDAAAFDELGQCHAPLKLVLLQNILRGAHQTVTRLNREVAALAG